MTYIALLTTAGLIGAVALKEVNQLRRLRRRTAGVHPAHEPVDRIR